MAALLPLTIQCAKCGAVIEEKCPRCMRRAEIKGRLSDALEEFEKVLAGAQCPGVNRQTAVVCWCGKCRRYFEQGADGKRAGGWCEGCAPTQMQLNADGLNG